MKTPQFPPVVEDPPKGDSPDLSDDEVEGAVDTRDVDDLAKLTAKAVAQDAGFTVTGHELKRRGDHLYWRTRMAAADEPDKVLVFRVDWLGR